MFKPVHLILIVGFWSSVGPLNAQLGNGFQRISDEVPNLAAEGESISSVTTRFREKKVDFDQFITSGDDEIEGSISTTKAADGCFADNEVWIESTFSPKEGGLATSSLSLLTDGGAFGSALRPNVNDRRNALSRCKVREVGAAGFEIVADPQKGLNAVGLVVSNIKLKASCTNPDKCFAEGFLSKQIGDTRIDARFDWQTQSWTIVGQIHEDVYDFEAQMPKVKVTPVNERINGPDLEFIIASFEIMDVGHEFSVTEMNVFGAGARVIQGEDVALDYEVELENYGVADLIVIR